MPVRLVLIWREERKTRRKRQRGKNTFKDTSDEFLRQFFPKAVRKLPRSTEKAQRRRAHDKSIYLDLITESIAPQSATGRDDHLVGFASTQFVGEPDITVVVYELKKMRAERERMSALIRDGDKRLRCQQSFRLNVDAWKALAQIAESQFRMAVAPATDNA